MGAYLEKPVTRKNTQENKNNILRYVCSQMQGWRINMEDAEICDLSLNGGLIQLFAIFDGHGGSEVAQFCKKNFVNELRKNKNFASSKFKEALSETFLKMDELLIQNQKKQNQSNQFQDTVTGGCTACVVMITRDKIYCANAGDSRAVLSQSGVAIPLSQDHKPDNPKEKQRIEKAGGNIWDGRVNGNINISRAIGDLQFKSDEKLPPNQQLIIAEPEIYEYELNSKSIPDFIVMGCDGIWEVLNNQQVVSHFEKDLKQKTFKNCVEEFLNNILAKDTKGPQNIEKGEKIVNPDEQEDIIDFILMDYEVNVRQMLEQLEQFLFNQDELQNIFVRISKIFNVISLELQKVENQDKDTSFLDEREQNEIFIQSSLLNSQQKKEINKMLINQNEKFMQDKIDGKNNIEKGNWKFIFDSGESLGLDFNQMLNKLEGKKNLMILIQLYKQGKICILGAFTSQFMNENGGYSQFEQITERHLRKLEIHQINTDNYDELIGKSLSQFDYIVNEKQIQLSYYQFLREERVFIVPKKIEIGQIIQQLILKNQNQEEKLEGFGGLQINGDTKILGEEQQLSTIFEFTQDKKITNSDIIDLFIQDRRPENKNRLNQDQQVEGKKEKEENQERKISEDEIFQPNLKQTKKQKKSKMIGKQIQNDCKTDQKQKEQKNENENLQNIVFDFQDKNQVQKIFQRDFNQEGQVMLLNCLGQIFRVGKKDRKIKINMINRKIFYNVCINNNQQELSQGLQNKLDQEQNQGSSLAEILIQVIKNNSFIQQIENPYIYENLLTLLKQLIEYEDLLSLFVQENFESTLFEEFQNIQIQIKFNEKNYQKNLIQESKQLDFKKQEELAYNFQKIKNQYHKILEQLKNNLEFYGYINIFNPIKNLNELNKLENQDKNGNIQQNQKFIQKMSLDNKYQNFMKQFLCRGVDMSNMKHHFEKENSNKGVINPQKITRLIQEIAEMNSSLPSQISNAIFVAYNNENLDYMKALIMGSEDTPYANGSFIFDIYFDCDYPNSPPKCVIVTTGHGKVRFNPNLYKDGKVCLSLLGTWRGQNNIENWNPKVSNLTQILISIQSMVMSNQVLFNEPGYQDKIGTKEGDLNNAGYINVVRWSTLRYGMIEQIRNPNKAFEDVILANFSMKREIILKQMYQWINEAEKPALYEGLTYDHNKELIDKIKQIGYKEMLIEQVEILKAELDKLQQKFKLIKEGQYGEQQQLKLKINYNMLSPIQSMDQKIQKLKDIQMDVLTGAEDLSKIDVTYSEIKTTKQMDIQNKEFENRVSRSIGALGKNAIVKQSTAQVFIAGMDSTGIEIAKNLVLTGVQKVVIYDKKKVEKQDLLGQFYLEEKDVEQKKNRAEASVNKLQSLNQYVQVESYPEKYSLEMGINKTLGDYFLGNFDVIILINQDQDLALKINAMCRKNDKKVYFLNVQQIGFYTRIINDFGDEFIVEEQDSEPPVEILIEETIFLEEDDNKFKFKLQLVQGQDQLIQQIEKNMQFQLQQIDNNQKDDRKQILVTVLEKQLKQLQQNDQGIQKIHEIIVQCEQNINFGNCLGKQIKNKKLCQFQSLREIYQGLTQNEDKIKELPFDKQFFYCQGILPAQSAITGGLTAQEALKAITKKWNPIEQIMFYDTEELADNEKINQKLKEIVAQQEDSIINILINQQAKEFLDLEKLLQIKITQLEKIKNDNIYYKLAVLLGMENLENLQNQKIFQIGAGAIGCELLKNYAMLGIGSQKNGQILVTDPDLIENSNLSRQFLFREKHIKKSKSMTAAAVIQQFNKQLQGKIFAKQDKIGPQSENMYNDQFIRQQNIIMNALDNVQARVYVDQRCVKNQVPLIESGTLGSKGHVQVVIPFLTESYGSKKDPQNDSNQIPVCTLKMFPEETIHCVEWARDKFQKFFNDKIQNSRKILQKMIENETDSVEFEQIQKLKNFLENMPKNFKDCIMLARNKFEKLFNHNIQDLLTIYPLDKIQNDGSLFWSLPKRPPKIEKFDKNNQFHKQFIIAFGVLMAQNFNIQIPEDIGSEQIQERVLEIYLQDVKIKEHKLTEEKIKNIQDEVEKKDQNDKKNEKQNEKTNQQKINQNNIQIEKQNLIEEICQIFSEFLKYDKKNNYVKIQKKMSINNLICPIEFEKDDDNNFHIDFLTSMTNIRAYNYGLEQMEWIDVKLKAGRILPALATTTSSIAGLQCIEMIKVLTLGIKNRKLENFKNSYMNLAIPFLQQSEPGIYPKYKITQQITVNIWDKWEINIIKGENDFIEGLFSQLQNKYGIFPVDLIQGTSQIYIKDLYKNKKDEDKKIRYRKLIQMLNLDDADEKYADVNITFTQENQDNQEIQQGFRNKIQQRKYIQGVPLIRLKFNY
ncbi:Ubiquitin-conjugating enzyme/RWD-like protein [Pseudocohnilembus persalinus]|uniref:Ubiquitin-conjugating enzyme/RWD-like protein n=1 Tax=Pseudocohnilembus persalinus TaxID=266149 RepID=A0A0V0R0H3_PSEPJ|nr:Ubiquitin-conjugating enzyme/RWD-like protein [Pseudocohnilembus persalinus]|eukprot:KRX07656.1 Ubiquitin-conjugating enzyme/RWD-like protein [Pseudocohnilembus persalinus]